MRAVRWLFSCRRVILVVAALGASAWLGQAPAARLRDRLPDPFNRNPHLRLITDLDPPPVAGTPLVSLRPRLELWGVVEGVDPSLRPPDAGDTVLRVSVYRAGQKRLRDDAVIAIRVSTPDLLEIVANYLTPARRRALAERLGRFYRKHERTLKRAAARAKALAGTELGADELGRALWKDPAIRGALSGALEREVTRRIDWDRVRARALQSEAADVASDLLLESGVGSPAWAGLREGYASRWRSIWGDEPKAAPRPGADPESTLPAFLRPLTLFVPRWQDARRAALSRAAENVQTAYPRYREELKRTGVDLLEQVAGQEKISTKGLLALGAIGRDEALREAVRSRYGPEAWRRVQRLAGVLARDAALREELRETVQSGLELFAQVLREVALDETGEGPNPLLVAFVRARLLHKTRPVLVVEDPGTGSRLADGQVFVGRTR